MPRRPLKATRSFSEVRTRQNRTCPPRVIAGIRQINDVARELLTLIAFGCLAATITTLTLSAIELDTAIVHAIANKIESNTLSLWEWLIVILGAAGLCAALRHEATRHLHRRRKRTRQKPSDQIK